MAVYSHSQLGTYEQCPLKYKLSYRDKIKRDTEGVEAFLGGMVHEALKKCYDDAKLARLDTLDELLAGYDRLWRQHWHDGIIITKQGVSADNYHALGKKMLQTYYGRYAPFDADTTIQTEMRLNFSLDEAARYKLTGYIDRLSRTSEGTYQIHDYKTSAYLPSQEDADNDRQLGLYHIGVQRKWPGVRDIKLIWHYLAFDQELVSSRSDEAVARLISDTAVLIEEIESAREFPPRESGLCEWCEYPDLCPTRKHLFAVEALPPDEYVREPGVVLVDRYAELRSKAGEIDEETTAVKEALVEYAREQGLTAIRGSQHQVRVRFDSKLKFPGKGDPDRENLDATVTQAGKWPEVSQLDTTALTRIVEEGLWERSSSTRYSSMAG
jgi:putative RecB family exonuclease